jgi:hypothetical protein
MQHMIVWLAIVGTAAFLVGCNDPTGPTAPGTAQATLIVDGARRRPKFPPPDSVYIPPMPIPPIIEEFPRVEDVP